MVLEELSRAQERLQDIDVERSSLSTAIDLVCGHLRVSQSGEMSAQTPRMVLISSHTRELVAIVLQLGVLIAPVTTQLLGEDLFKKN